MGVKYPQWQQPSLRRFSNLTVIDCVKSYRGQRKQLLRELNGHSIRVMKHEDRALFDGLDLLRSVEKYRLGMPEE